MTLYSSIYQSIIYLSTYQSFFLPIFLPSIFFLPIYIYLHVPINLSFFLPKYISLYLVSFFYLSIFIYPSIYLSTCWPVYISLFLLCIIFYLSSLVQFYFSLWYCEGGKGGGKSNLNLPSIVHNWYFISNRGNSPSLFLISRLPKIPLSSILALVLIVLLLSLYPSDRSTDPVGGISNKQITIIPLWMSCFDCHVNRD